MKSKRLISPVIAFAMIMLSVFAFTACSGKSEPVKVTVLDCGKSYSADGTDDMTVGQLLEKAEIDGNLLFFWKGKHSDRPLVLMSHQDVVPAEGKWLHDPFSGDIADGKVWARGASDTKCSVMAFFQAVEELL